MSEKKDIYDPSKPFNEQVRKCISETHPKDGPIILEPFGKRFKKIKDPEFWKDYEDMEGTDGIGTKGYLHWLYNTVENGAQDAFAMVMDDLIEGGFIPVHLQDHILMQEENEERIYRITGALKDLCCANPWELDGYSNPIIITGGETAIINTIKGFEMGITGTGYARLEDQIYPNARPGDVLIGIASPGIQSNGLSFYREELFDKRRMDIDSMLPWNKTVGDELTLSTRIYLPALKDVLRKYSNFIHGFLHITGGGQAKAKELIKRGDVDIEINNTHKLVPQNIFHYAFECGIPSKKMYSKFNNGVGYMIAVPESKADDVIRTIETYFPADKIGSVSPGKGRLNIKSQYDNASLDY